MSIWQRIFGGLPSDEQLSEIHEQQRDRILNRLDCGASESHGVTFLAGCGGVPLTGRGGLQASPPDGVSGLWADTQERAVTQRAWNAAATDQLDFTVNWSDGENPRDLIVSVRVDWANKGAVFIEVNGKLVAVYDDSHGLVAFGVPDEVPRAMRSVSVDLNDLASKATAIARLLNRQVEIVEKGPE